MDLYFQYVIIRVEEMATEDNGKFFGTVDTMFLSQQVDRVLLGIGGDDIRIITCTLVVSEFERFKIRFNCLPVV